MVKRRNEGITLGRYDRVFDMMVTVFMLILLFIMAYPIYYVIIASFSDLSEVGLGNVYLLPKGFQTSAYRNLFINDDIWTGYLNSIFYTVAGTLYDLVLLLPLAFALSKKKLFGRGVVISFFLFTMFFSGGIVPAYLLRSQLGLIDTRLVMIFSTVSAYYLVITRTFFSNSIPEELYESAKLDGASDFNCFFRIALPLSGAIIAVMALYSAVNIWNSYFNALMYINKRELFPLQLVLRRILIMNQQLVVSPEFWNLSEEGQLDAQEMARIAGSMKYSVIIVGSLPMLIAYPFVQKYFVKGVMIGSLKG